MKLFLLSLLSVAIFELVLAFIASFLHLAGTVGRKVSDTFTRAPVLDLLVGLFTWIPWIVCSAIGGWRGLAGCLLGELLALFGWITYHELIYRQATKGPRIVKFLNRTVGRWQNHLALIVTMVALPGFLFIRIVEIVCYPMLVKLLNFPAYRGAEWVNVSRQKFEGLVGHDLIWCLYCDWMTGVYSLGAEMLRNVESFWCPIRFYDGKKCDNCKVDFPDINGGWVAPDGNMAQVEYTMEQMYGKGERSWFGHPVRLTVKGK